MILVLSGLPATGKSTFGAWLATHHGFRHVDADGGSLAQAKSDAWSNLVTAPSEKTASDFLQVLGTTGQPVVWDWGFPPRLLSCVHALKDVGATLWWFTGSESVARKRYIARNRGHVHAFDYQVIQIRQNWPEIEALFRPNFLTTLCDDGSYLSSSSTYEYIMKRNA